MQEYHYIIRQETYMDGNTSRTSFGVAAVINISGNIVVIRAFSDVTSNHTLLKQLVRICNEQQLDLIHLQDVIEDFIAM